MAQKMTAPKEDLELVQSFTGSECAPNKVLKLKWQDLDDQIGGFPKVLLGLMVTLDLTINTVALTMPAAMQNARLLDAILSCTFKMDEHTIINGVSGLDLHHDSRRLGGAPVAEADGQDIADADSTGQTGTVRVYIPFGVPNAAPGAEYDGGIMLAALRQEDFAIKMSGGDLGGFPGVTWTAATVTVEAHWVAWHKCPIPTNWQVGRLTTRETRYTVTPPAGHLYYFDIFDHAEAAGWDFDHSDYLNLDVAIGQGKLVTKGDPSSLARLHNLRARRSDLGADLLTVATPEFIPLIPELRGGMASKQPMGPIRVQFTGRATHDDTNYIYRTRGTRHDGWRATYLKRIGANPAAIGQQLSPASGEPSDVPAVLRPHIDETVVWAGMPYRGVVELNRHKYPRVLGG